LASLDLLQHQPERFQQFEARHTPLLQALSAHPRVSKARCLGTVAAFDLDAGDGGYLNPVGKVVQRLCLERDVFLRPLGSVVYLLPPLGISDRQLAKCYGALGQALDLLDSAV